MAESGTNADRQLVTRMQQGDQAAFKAFFDAYFPRLFRFASGYFPGDAASIEDVVQMTLTAAIESLSNWRGDASLYTWLCRICSHKAADYKRSRRRRLRRVVPIQRDESRESVMAKAVAPPRDAPGAVAEAGEIGRIVHGLLDALPANYSEALELKYVQGLTVEEIAGQMGTSTTAVQSVLARARSAFRKSVSALSAAERQAIESLF